MQYKCPTCGAQFFDIQQFANHKKVHLRGTGESSGVTCLGCASKIPLQPSQMTYSGPLTCPRCGKTMKVTLEGGEVVVARLG
jgi:DNA-directed RNA polymerase subunit RPC12/RpoP